MAGEQTAANVIVAILAESAAGTPATPVASAERVRLVDSPGLVLDRAIAASAEKRADGNTQKGRHSAKTVGGSLNTELTAGGAVDTLFEAIMRSTWVASATSAFSVFTSISLASNVYTAVGGSFITQGFRVGQMIYTTGSDTAANDSINMLVSAVTASTMTVVGPTLTDDAGPDSSGTFNRHAHVINAAAPTRRHFTIDQYDVDIDLSEQFLGCKLTGLSLNIVPNAPVTVSFTFQGFDRVPLNTGASPYFTTPSLTTGLSVVGDDITLVFNGSVVTTFTSLTLDWTIQASGIAVLGSVVTPDIFGNDLTVSGTATVIRSDHAQIILYDAETEFAIGVILQDITSAAPFSGFGLWFPVVTIDGINAPVGGGDGPKVESLQLGFGTAVAAAGQDATICLISSTEEA